MLKHVCSTGFHITIPNEVYAELIAGSHSAATLVSTLDWLNVCAVTDVEQIEVLQRDAKIHIGEAAAIVLAEELRAERLLVDERAARRVAITRQLPVIGTVGILLLAKQQKLLEDIKPVLGSLIENGTRIGPRLYEQALEIAEEPTR